MSDKVKERQKRILHYLQIMNAMSVNQLAGLLKVSVETVRKDLAELTRLDLVIRVHGGVALSRQTPGSFDSFHQLHAASKRRASNIAVDLIHSESTVILGDGSTVFTLAQALRYSRPELLSTLTVITNSFSILSLFEFGKSCERLFFLGGMCDHARQSTLGHFASQQVGAFHAQQAFISPSGVSPTFNVVAISPSDATFQIEVMRHADEKILIVDRSKFLSMACFNVAPLKEFDYVVTDMNSSDPLVQQLIKKKISIYYPEAD